MKRERGCDQIRRRLSVRVPQAEPMEEATRMHLEICAGCSAFLNRLERLEAQVIAWPNHTPSASLAARISVALVAESASCPAKRAGGISRLQTSLKGLKEHRTMIKRISWAGAALVGVLILTAGHQRGHATSVLKRMGDASQRIKTVHLIGWNCELSPDVAAEVANGNTGISTTRVLPHRFEAWIKNGQWREAQDHDVTVYTAGKTWQNGVPVPDATQPPLLTFFALRAITGENSFGPGVEFTSQILGEDVLNGQTTTKLVLESKKKPGANGVEPVQERRLFWLDPNSYLPIRMEQMRYNLDRWELDAVVWFDYNQPVSNTLFDAAKVRMEPHGRLDYLHTSAQGLYRFTNDQYDQYTTILSENSRDQKQINADTSLTQVQKNDLLKKTAADCNLRLRKMMTPDQQRLFDDWWYVQPKILEKLWTPQQRKEDAKWHAEQMVLMKAWFASQDEQTQNRLHGSIFGTTAP